MKAVIKKEIDAPVPLANQLRAVEEELAHLEELKDALRNALLKTMKGHALSYIKTEDGTQYVRTQRSNLKILNKALALEWAKENVDTRMKLDTSAALSALDYDHSLSKIFGTEKSEYLRITRPKEKGDE